ncbi:MAG: hypothetical protein ACKO3V_11325, partial [Pirellula sp.]
YLNSGEEAMSSQKGGVCCELLGGGPQDGVILNMSRRHDIITHTFENPEHGANREHLEKTFIESMYMYSGSYRDCSKLGRIYQYTLADVVIRQAKEIEDLCQDINETVGHTEDSIVQPEDLLGIHGGDDTFDF